MKHNPFYYVVCLEKYMDILLEKKKPWTEKTFKQISNMLNYPIPIQMYTA